MKKRFVYVTDSEWFEEGALKNPIMFLEHKLQEKYPEFFELEYDLRLLVTREASAEERAAFFYNDYREKYGDADINALKNAAANNAKNVFLNGFDQEHLEYLIPYIKDSVEVLYLFKCPQIYDLSILSKLKNLKCLLIYWNNSIKSLWNVKDNLRLKVLSFVSVTKLSDIGALVDSNIEYVMFDSEDNNGNKKSMLFDKTVFDKMKNLKHLTLNYKGVEVDY